MGRVCVPMTHTQKKKKDKQRKPDPRVPNAKYIPLARVGYAGGPRWYTGGHVGFARLFRYQHVGILNAEGFALRWNIGLRLLRQYIPDLLTLLLSLRQDKHVQEVRENKLSRSQGDNGTEASS